MKDVPKLGGPDSLFYRAGMGPPGYPSRLPLPGATTQFSQPGNPASQTPGQKVSRVRSITVGTSSAHISSIQPLLTN